MRKLTIESFIQKAKSVHGEKYNYSKVEYAGTHNKVTIICPEHGEFEQRPSDHLQGGGCPHCANESKKSTQEDFISKAKEKHVEKYNYSKVDYVDSNTKVIITCGEHGEFLQIPNHHLQGKGCPSCGGNKKLTTESFIAKAKQVHGDNKYDYSKVQYVNNSTKVTIICHEHGEFEQKPNGHLSQAQGCPKCAVKIKKTTEEFIAKAKSVHGEKYNYDKVQYVGSQVKVTIGCNEHGDFEQEASSHLRGTGCTHCGYENIGWTRTKFVNRCNSKDGIGTLYVIECYNENETFIKFGITSRTIEERYNSKIAMPYNYRILAECVGTPEMIYNLEVGLKRQMRLSHYVPLIEFGGSVTECFIRTEEE